MLRLMWTLIVFALSWMFSPDDSGGGDGNDGGGNQGGNQGNQSGQGSSGGSGQSGSGGEGSNEGGRNFSQEDVNRIAGQRATESAESAQRRIADDLGVSLDEAKTIIANHQEQERKNQSELDREKGDRTKAEGERDSWKTKYESLEKSTLLSSALMNAGAKPARVEGLVKMADQSKLKVKDGKLEGADEVVESLSDGYPELFEAKQDDDGKGGQQQRRGKQGGGDHRAADANGSQQGGGRPKDLKEALQAHYG